MTKSEIKINMRTRNWRKLISTHQKTKTVITNIYETSEPYKVEGKRCKYDRWLLILFDSDRKKLKVTNEYARHRHQRQSLLLLNDIWETLCRILCLREMKREKGKNWRVKIGKGKEGKDNKVKERKCEKRIKWRTDSKKRGTLLPLTPNPIAAIKLCNSVFWYILSFDAFSIFKILPLRGKIAWWGQADLGSVRLGEVRSDRNRMEGRQSGEKIEGWRWRWRCRWSKD